MIRAKLPSDEAWAREHLTERWGPGVASASGFHDAALLDGLVAELDAIPIAHVSELELRL